VDGDFYINTVADTIFGPKAAGVWGSGTSIVGPQGAQGNQGIQGRRESKVRKGCRVIKDLLESRDHRVTLGHRESRAYKDCRVKLGQRGRK